MSLIDQEPYDTIGNINWKEVLVRSVNTEKSTRERNTGKLPISGDHSLQFLPTTVFTTLRRHPMNRMDGSPYCGSHKQNGYLTKKVGVKCWSINEDTHSCPSLLKKKLELWHLLAVMVCYNCEQRCGSGKVRGVGVKWTLLDFGCSSVSLITVLSLNQVYWEHLQGCVIHWKYPYQEKKVKKGFNRDCTQGTLSHCKPIKMYRNLNNLFCDADGFI